MYILFSEADLQQIVKQLAAAIAGAASERPLLLLGLLKGCQPFLGDLCRALSAYDLQLAIDYLAVSSYIGRSSSGEVTISDRLPEIDWPAWDVIVVDDVFDTGLTLSAVVSHLQARGAGRVRTCVLLQKPGCARVGLTPDYCGADIGDYFVVGYGLDYNERFRELPYIKVLENVEI